MNRMNVDHLPCPHCGRFKDRFFEFNSKGFVKHPITGNYRLSSFFVSKDSFTMFRSRKGKTYHYNRPPRYAICLGCNNAIKFPDYRSNQWKNPLRCVKRAFAEAKANKHARSAIQQFTPRKRERKETA